MNKILERILRESNSPDLLTVLAESLTPTDLQSLLLEVYRLRAARQTPAGLLNQYEHNRFVRPSPLDPRRMGQFDLLAFQLAAPLFQPVDLSPLCPLGATSVVSPVDQNCAIATIRNTEVVSDSTNVLALECAQRRRVLLQLSRQARERVRLCASQRLVRAQNYNRPAALAHFRLFALCTAGRDEGSYRFELEVIAEHIAFYLSLLAALNETGYALRNIQVGLTDFEGGRLTELLQTAVILSLAGSFPGVNLALAPQREAGRGYYAGLCFEISARDPGGNERSIVDGGLTDWTQHLLNNKKERLLISGIGTERVCSLFSKDGQ